MYVIATCLVTIKKIQYKCIVSVLKYLNSPVADSSVLNTSILIIADDGMFRISETCTISLFSSTVYIDWPNVTVISDNNS